MAFINDLLTDLNQEGGCDSEDFMVKTESFLTVLGTSKTHQHWCPLINHQTAELNQILKQLDVFETCDFRPTEAATEMKGTNDALVYFEPLVDENLKIPCSELNCKSSFSYKRSYKKHMTVYHSHLPLEKVRDPAGTCRLIR